LTRSKSLCLQRELPRAENDNLEVLLQLKLDREGKTLLGTSGNGFVVWEFGDSAHHPNKAVVLPLPHGVRNISTRVLYSNSCMISSARDYVIAGVRLTKCTRHTACPKTHIHLHSFSFTAFSSLFLIHFFLAQSPVSSQQFFFYWLKNL